MGLGAVVLATLLHPIVGALAAYHWFVSRGQDNHGEEYSDSGWDTESRWTGYKKLDERDRLAARAYRRLKR